MNRTLVALDLETTGLDPETDEIIEVGAVKFRGDEVVATFESLVNPGRVLPYRVQLLCGIEQGRVDCAPSFAEIADSLRSFLEGCSVVGHNVSFDLGFLARKGLEPPGVAFDTWELATVLLFAQPDYSLSSLTGRLGLSRPGHRALADAMATKELFVALFERATRLGLGTIETLVGLAEKAEWPAGSFFRQALQERVTEAFSVGTETQVQERDSGLQSGRGAADSVLSASAERVALDADALTAMLGPGGTLARSIPGYEFRPGQIEMMQGVARSLNECDHFIVEAGTGIGKSLAYLLPSALFARENGVPVVVSTNTINLQEQLMGKDIPDLVAALSDADGGGLRELRVAQLKGRSNYLCVRKYETLLASSRLSLEQARLLARVTVWLLSTWTGDRGELNLAGSDLSLWYKMCAEPDPRLESRCPHRQKDSCFLHRARSAAGRSHIVVVNHALLLSDMVADSKILPQYRHLVVDEAHHLEDEATEQLGSRVTQWDIINCLNRFRQDTGGQRRTGLLSWLSESVHGAKVAVSRRSQLVGLVEALGAGLDRADVRGTQFLDRVRSYVEVRLGDRGGYDRYLLLTDDMRGEEAWSAIETGWEDLGLALSDVATSLDRLYVKLDSLEERELVDRDHLMLELAWLYELTVALALQLEAFVMRPDRANVYWFVLAGQNQAIEFHSAPLSVAGALQRFLFNCKDSVVLTSATLSTGGTFDYARGRLGVEGGRQLLLGAPFDYKASTLVYLPHDMPAPTHPGYQEALQKALIELCGASRGRALVLFTSHSSLRTTLSAIRVPLEEEGILVLGHGVDGSPKQLQAAMMENPATVLLGTASFWEGIDVVGKALSVVAMARLPFNVPTDPVFSARSALFDDPFNEYAIPQAAIRFKQGFGRLIRSKEDRGVVVIFDKRLQSKRYGATFLKSVPECTLLRGPTRDMPDAVSRWLDGVPASSARPL